MAGELGKASLDLEANLGPFERNVTAADATSDRLKGTLEALAAVADAAQSALNDVKLGPGQGTRSKISAEEIVSGVRGISEEAHDAARALDRVHLSEAQAAETAAAGAVMDHELENIHDKADRAKRALDGVRLRLAAAGGAAGGAFGGRPGLGPFGAGYGRLGAIGTLVGVGALTAPAAAPAAAGLLAGIPTLATGAAGALGTLVLAFSGLGKAIGGDKKAFDALTVSQKEFVQTVRSLDPLLKRLKQIAAQSLFPGFTKGLKSALSPGTVNAVETGIVQLGRALGSAGAEWGKYFGSAKFQHIFGPLMQSAARNIGVLSDAALHLFDAFGVLGRAAIPLTNWLNDAIDRGAKFADSWLRARDATGQLTGAMHEAQTSLRLVGGLAASLLRVVFALGKALYPIAKVAVKDLTDGLNALAGIIDRNKGAIRAIIGTALDGLKYTIEGVSHAVKFLVDQLGRIIGDKAGIVAAIGAIGIALALSLGPESVIIVGAIAAVGLIVNHWKTVKTFFVNLGREIINAFKYVWYILEKGALKAALAIVEPFSHLPGFMGGWARRAKDAMQGQLDKLHPPNMAWGAYAEKAGASTGMAWVDGFRRQTAGEMAIARAQFVADRAGVPYHPPKKHHHHTHEPAPGTHDWYMKYLGYDPTTMPTFGTPPPFTKNTGTSGSKAPVIPATVSHLEDLASQQASKAQNAKTARAIRMHLDAELGDLEKAEKILRTKYEKATGKAKTRLFHELTKVENQIRDVRTKLKSVFADARQNQLDFALAQAKVAVENAKQGSKAYDEAIAAEEKALKNEIAFWAKRAKNLKLSLAVRTAALKKELAYQKALKQLLAPVVQAQNANIAQFLQSFVDIQNAFAPNAVPYQGPTGGGTAGKTNTHLHDIKNEQRQTNRHLKAIRDAARFPGSSDAHSAAMAVG